MPVPQKAERQLRSIVKMKNLLYIIVCSLLVISCTAQKNAPKIYAYRQAVLGGPAPMVITDEKGNTTEAPRKAMFNFMIYVESPAANIDVKRVWINQRQYPVTTQPAQTPVLMTTTIRPDARPDTLVRFTKNKVLQVHLEGDSQTGEGRTGTAPRVTDVSPKVMKQIRSNALVVHCVVNGKDEYYTAKAIKNLPPVALQ
jgi:hypothetical protein